MLQLRNKQEALLKASTISLLQDGLTIQQARQSAQLSLIKKESGQKTAHALIYKLILELKDFAPIKASEEALVKWAFKILQDFWHFKIEEIAICFNKGINGDFGKIYGELKYIDLTEWLNKYDVNKTEFAAEEAAKFKEGFDQDRNSLTPLKALIGKGAYYEKIKK